MNIWLVGGEKVIPASVETAIKGDGYTVTRINGSDRYETAKLISEAGIKLSGKKPSKVFVASGTSFADALAVSPIAFAKGYSIALTEKDSTSQYTKDQLGAIGTDNKILVGGEAVVSKKVQADLSIKDDMRVAGADRAVTANLVSDWAKKSEGFNPANAALVGGTNGNGADSLVAAPLGGKSFTTLHFAGWDATYVYLKDHAAELTGKGFVFGGKAAVSEGQVADAQKAAQTVNANQVIKVDATDAAVLPVSTSATDNKGSREYTASGLDSNKKYNIALLPTANVKKAADGTITFADSTGDLVADGTQSGAVTTAKLEVINGVSANATRSVGIVPIDGKVNFTVDSQGYDDVVPVIWLDNSDAALNSGSLDLLAPTSTNTDPKAAVESIGVGGAISWKPAEATADVTGGTVLAVDAESKYLVISDNGGTPVIRTFNLKDGDLYKYTDSTPTVQDTSASNFKAAVSVGDTVTTAYSSNFKSTFTLVTDKPATATNLAVAEIGNLDNNSTSNFDVKFSWKAPAPALGLIKDYSVTVYETDSKGKITTTPVGTAHTSAAGELTVRADNLANGKYAARIVTNSQQGGVSTASDPVYFTVQKGNADATAPTVRNAFFTKVATGAGAVAGDFQATDKITLQFSESIPASAVATGQVIRFKDADGELYQVAIGAGAGAGVQATAARASWTPTGGSAIADGQVVLTLTDVPQKVGSGSGTPTAGAQHPATITAFSTAWADAAGNKVDLAGSADLVIDVPLP
ncbi:cell wall-binding repeat-containing protein [Streptomyces sp. NP160]|uniref:cell wall-binding repeat-containing protein n=1 Tax=Streptomyces sp. NP160 TaxID=2586637 RepID=UPI00111933E3|nr:cell wall-binding repeat-containing protein [Streptomyces sp. NP160]TNM68795.1 cell wall-binding repeat-containing protein [Streptomyces sp. NP160]